MVKFKNLGINFSARKFVAEMLKCKDLKCKNSVCRNFEPRKFCAQKFRNLYNMKGFSSKTAFIGYNDIYYHYKRILDAIFHNKCGFIYCYDGDDL